MVLRAYLRDNSWQVQRPYKVLGIESRQAVHKTSILPTVLSLQPLLLFFLFVFKANI